MTSTPREEVDKLMAIVAQQRDELNLQLHLGMAEARGEWEVLEAKWQMAQGKLAQLQAAADQSQDEIAAAARLLAEELKRGYERIRSLI
jgi:hypothetical protein